MIIGYQIVKVNAERNDAIIPQDPIQVSYKVSTKNVGKDDNTKTLRFGFLYEVDLKDSKDNKVGNITMEGSVIYAGNNIDDIYNSISSNGKLDQNVQKEIVQGISNICILEAMQIAKQIQLPPLLKLPDLTSQQPDTNIETKN